MNSILVFLDRILGKFAHCTEFIERAYVTLVDILHVFLVNKTWQALETLFLRRVEIQAYTMDGAPFTKPCRGPNISRLHHCLDDVESGG